MLDAQSEDAANDLAVRYLERAVNAWMRKQLPLPVLARAMMGMGVSCVEGAQGHEMATEMVRVVAEKLAETSPQQGLPN